MVHGNVGQSDLTREDMTRYIRYLVDVIGEEQKALYSYLDNRTNPYICLHGECQTLADWISVLLEAYNQPFQRWDMGLDLLVFDRLVNEMEPNEVPRQITEWYLYGLKDFPSDLRGRTYLHTVIEWDGLYWDANGGGTRRDKEEYYEGMTYWTDGEVDRKRLLHNFFDWEEMKGYLEWPLVEESIDYTWHWTESFNREDLLPEELWIEEMGTGVSPYDNLGVFRDFINHLRTDDFSAETVLRYEWGRTDSGIYHSSVYDKGELVGTIGLKSFDREELNSQCYDDFEWVLRELEWKSNRSIQDWHIGKWVVFDVWLDESYRNKGIGHKMYENIFKIKNNNPHTIIVGYTCEPGGTTSYDAKAVYERLQRKYIGKGLVVSSIKKDDFAAERIYFDDEYGGFIKGNPRAGELPGEVLFPGEDERLAKIMTPEEFAELEQEVNLILSKNLPYNVESLSEDELIALHEDIIVKIINHEYIHQSIDEEVLDWARENNKTKGDYYAGHEIMAYVDMALRESLGMRGFKLHLTNLVSQHPILTDNPELGERVMDALTRTRKGQRFQVPAEIETLMQAFQSEDYEILVVGGAVRDMLMGLKPKDYDLATNATPEQVEDVVSPLAGYRVITTPEAQMARGVLTTLVLPPSGEVIEVTTFRAELGYEEGTRRPVAVAADTFYEDSLRRDFTMNALGWRLNGTILDYHDGVDDIEFGQLVSVGAANERLEEDPLRILRAVRFASRYGLEIDDDLGEAIGMNLPQLLTLSPERVRRELDSILKLEEGVYDLVNIGIIETIIPQYQGGYWGDRGYGGGDPKFSFIEDIQSYSMVDQSYPSQFNYTPRPWQPSLAYALLFKNVVTKEEFNEQYRRGPISFSRAEADMIAELIALYPVALESEDPRDVVAIVTSPYYAELMLMLEYTNRLDLVDYFTPYRQRYKGKPPKGYAMTVADEYGIEPGPALGDKISEITEAIILGDIEDWDEGLNYYAAEGVYDMGGYRIDLSKTYSPEEVFEIAANNHLAGLSAERDPYEPNFENPKYDVLLNEIMESPKWEIVRFGEKELREKPVNYAWMDVSSRVDSDGTPIVISNSATIIDGNHRFTAALKGNYSVLAFVPKGEVWWLDWFDESLEDKRNYFEELDADLAESDVYYYAAEEVGTRERIAYAGVILDENTSEQLLARFESEIPESWTRYAHHMTVSLGKSIPNQADLGKEVTLTVTAVGKSEDAIAVAVSGYPSRNAIPHITLAVPPGGKPFNSNKITDWHSVEPFEIQGQLQDVKTYVAEEIETFRSESSRDWSYQYTWQPVPVEDLIEFRLSRYNIRTIDPQWRQHDDILNLKTLYRGTRKPSSIREGLFDFFGGGEIYELEQIPETVYFYTWERPYPTEQWERHNAGYECACDECDKYAFNYSFANYKGSGLIHSNQFKPEWEETLEGSEVVRVLFVPHLSEEIGVGTFPSYRSHVTRNNLNLDQYGFEPVIWSTRNSKNSNGEFYSSPYNTNLRALEQRLGRNVGRTLNYPSFSSETVTKYAESFWGNAGSGVLVVARDTQRILLGLRSEDVNEPNTWGNFGGAIGVTDWGEPEEALPPEENALKEMAEEIGYTGAIEMIPSFTYRSPEFTYYNFIGIVEQESDVPLNQFNWEVSELQWFTLAEIMALPNLHFGVSALMSQEEMITFNAPGMADDFEITMKPQFVLFEELPQITQDDIVYMALHPTWGNSELSKEYSHIHPNYLKRDFIGLEFPVFYMPLSEIDFPPNHRRRHMPTVSQYSKQQNYTEAPPILVSGDKFIDGGHRFLAYELAGRRTIPVVDIGNLLTVTGLLDWMENDTVEDPISWDVGEDSLLDFTFNAEEMVKLYDLFRDIDMIDDLPPLQSVKYDDFGNPFVTFYHATTMDNYESIEAFGLRVSQPGWYEKAELETYDNVAGVYFTSDLEKAKVWIGWKYRESICYQMESLEEDGYEVSLIPNEIAGVVYAVDFPLELIDDKRSVQNVKPDPDIGGAWYSTNSIPRSKMSIVGFYSLPICLSQGWNDGGEGVQPITESMAKQIHERGFYVDAIPNPDYDEFRENISTDSAMIAKHGFYQTPFTDATRRGRRYLPLHHILSPRDPIFSGYRGTFMAESIPMSDWSKLSPVELVELSQFPSGDSHTDGWDMYLPQDWPHWDVMELAENEYRDMVKKYEKDNDIRYLSWDDRKNLPYTPEEMYAKYFDFWYIPGVANSMSGGGRGDIYDSLKEAYASDSWKQESNKRGLPCQETLSLEEAAKYLPPQTIEWHRELGRKNILVWNEPIVNAYIDEHLALGREGIFYAPVLAAASVDVEVGTDATLMKRGARLLDGWHRDAYANLLYDQDPSQGGAPTVFFKPKEEYL